MPASLAEKLATAWLKAQRVGVALDWPNLPSEERAVWEAVADVARELCASAVVGYRCQCGIDHMFEAREVAIERITAERDEARTNAKIMAGAADSEKADRVGMRALLDEARAENERLRASVQEWRNWADDVAPPFGSGRDRSDAGQRAHIAEKLTNAAWGKS